MLIVTKIVDGVHYYLHKNHLRITGPQGFMQRNLDRRERAEVFKKMGVSSHYLSVALTSSI